MTQAKHTPTPWATGPTAGNHQHLIYGQDDPSGKTVALVYTDANDAAFIIRAVNAHAALVEALANLHAWADRCTPDGLSNKEWAEFDSAVQEAGAALTLIQES